jgi:hypothetical protein
MPMIKYGIKEGLYVICGLFVFVVLVLLGMRYIISGDRLYIKMFFSSFESINIANIISVKRSYNPLSSPASSLKRLRIDYRMVKRKKYLYLYMLISPVREQEFIDELKDVNSDISVNVPVKKGIWRIQDWDI